MKVVLAAGAATVGLILSSLPERAAAQADPAGEIAALRLQNRALQQALQRLERRLDQLERSPSSRMRAAATPPAAAAPAAPPPSIQAASPATPPPRVTREEVDSVLAGTLPNSFRIPRTDISVRLYGFVKLNGFDDLESRQRGDAPSAQSVPLAGSAADRQGGDLQISARRSRFGMDTEMPTAWGSLRTQIEFDFAGSGSSDSGIANSGAWTPRLRQAWAEIGDASLRVLVGQSSSLWNDGIIETLSDSTFLNASAVRQAQLRLSARLAEGLVGQVSLEAPNTDYTAAAGQFYPDTTFQGGASPSFNTVPDLLGRLTYSGRFGSVTLRGLLRQLKVETDGTAAAGQGHDSAVGWGLALGTQLSLGDVAAFFGPDQLMLMGYYGEGIGRYFDSTSAGQAAVSTIGLQPAGPAALDPVRSYGVLVGYRLYWSTTVRSTAAYAYARLDNPSFAGALRGTSGAAALNRELQQGVVNLIWSPFARRNDLTVSPGWLDLGVEYMVSRRDLEEGLVTGVSHGTAQRVQATAIIRF